MTAGLSHRRAVFSGSRLRLRRFLNKGTVISWAIPSVNGLFGRSGAGYRCAMPKTNETNALTRVLVVVTPVLSAAMLALIGTAIRYLVKNTPKAEEAEPARGQWRFERGMPGYRAEMRSVAPVGPENPHSPPTPPFGIRRIGSPVATPASPAR